MAFVVEDGTGVDGANSLCDVADADEYWADRAGSAWSSLLPATKRASLVLASEYLSQHVPWIGVQAYPGDALAWPRVIYDQDENAPDFSGVPSRVIEATARVALAVAQGAELFGTVKPQMGATRYKAGSVEVQYSDDAARLALKGRPEFPWLLAFLRGYTDPGSDITSGLTRRVART